MNIEIALTDWSGELLLIVAELPVTAKMYELNVRGAEVMSARAS